MTTAFLSDDLGSYIEADPGSDLDYSITSWLTGLIFTDCEWSISPDVPGGLHDPSINVAPVTIDGVEYAIGKVASTWLTGLEAGQEYTVTARGTFTGNRIDERSFRVRCRNL